MIQSIMALFGFVPVKLLFIREEQLRAEKAWSGAIYATSEANFAAYKKAAKDVELLQAQVELLERELRRQGKDSPLDSEAAKLAYKKGFTAGEEYVKGRREAEILELLFPTPKK